MIYDGAKYLLQSIIEKLEGIQRADEEAWEDCAEIAEECVSALKKMAQPIYRPDKADDLEPPIDNPDAQKLAEAIPYAEALMGSIRMKNRVTALNSAKAALAAL